MDAPDTLRYSEEHEWVRVDDGTAVIGITDHAQEELGDIARAEETYRFVLGVDDKDEETLEALDRIYVEHGAHEALASVLRKRIAATDMPVDLVDLHFRLGQVLENDLQTIQPFPDYVVVDVRS